jgi:hydroxylamine oxidation protein HaoB
MARPQSKLLPSLGILLVTGGVLLLLWFAWLWFNPGPAPYRYQLVEEGSPDKFPKLGLDAWPDLTIAQYEVFAEGIDQPLAVTHAAKQGNNPPVRLDWENRTSELLLTTDLKLTELAALAGAINKHASRDALILGWWDTSRQIKLLSARDTLFTGQFSEHLIVPTPWQERADAVRKYEDEFWGGKASDDEKRRFERFADALIAEPKAGAAILRELAGGREAYIAIHVTDLYKLGIIRPGQFDIVYKNFPMEGNMHGMIGYLKNWMQENGFKTHTLQSLSDKMVRGYFLRDDKSSQTLIAQMLPFTTSQPLDLTDVQLIYQSGGYWVYKIPGGKESEASSNAVPGQAAPAPAMEPAPIPE